MVSNPPYVTEEEYASLPEEVKAEPYAALVGGSRCTAAWFRRRRNGSVPAAGCSWRSERIRGRRFAPVPAVLENVEVISDLAGRDRIVKGRLAPVHRHEPRNEVDPADRAGVASAVRAAGELVLAGQLVVLPTDTVYGIACRPDDPAAIDRLFEAKRRPTRLNLPVLAASTRDALGLALADDVARRLASALAGPTHPGPAAKRRLEGLATGGDHGNDRDPRPDHELALALLMRTGPWPRPARTSRVRRLARPRDAPGGLRPRRGRVRHRAKRSGRLVPGRLHGGGSHRAREPRVLREGPIDADAISRVAAESSSGARRNRTRYTEAQMGTILVICTGNICRSPMASGLLESLLRDRGVSGVTVESCGVSAWDGSPATPEGVEAAREQGLDISRHVARKMNRRIVESADLIVGMASEHREAVKRIAPNAAGRAFTLKELVYLLDSAGSPEGGTRKERLRSAGEKADLVRRRRRLPARGRRRRGPPGPARDVPGHRLGDRVASPRHSSTRSSPPTDTVRKRSGAMLENGDEGRSRRDASGGKAECHEGVRS